MRTCLSPKYFSLLIACWSAIVLSGCSFGPNSPNVRNAMDMLRIERDAAEDEYYALKHDHDETLWELEDLETRHDDALSEIKDLKTQLKKKRAATTDKINGASYEQLEPIDTANEFSSNSYPMNGETLEADDENFQSVEVSSPETLNSPKSDEGSAVSHIEIDQQLTRGINSSDKTEGDDGIMVALKPMDHEGQFVAIAAPVTISLIDPSRTGIRQRVGLWRFSSKQVASRIDYENRAFMFRLPWQRSAPLNPNLKLFIRFQADDGKRESEMDMTIALNDMPNSRWTAVESSSKEPVSSSPESAPATTFGGHEATDEPTAPRGPAGSARIARPEWSPIR